MYKRIFLLFCLVIIAKQGFNQPCFNVEIETRVDYVLPRCNLNDGFIDARRSVGGTPPYSYSIDTLDSQLGVFIDLGIGTYTLITTDARGCTSSRDIELIYKDLEVVITPDNTFTPNGDNINDTWRITGIDRFQGTDVRVFNRWGQQVFVSNPYINELGWDGTQNGSNAPPGTYFYVISVIDNCIEDHLAGSITIVR